MNRSLLILLIMLGFSLPVSAEVFIGAEDAIVVYDNDDSGLDVSPKRLIKGNRTGLGGLAGVEVYTGLESGSPTEIFVCTLDGEIFVFPVDADGNVAPSRSMQPEEPCKALAITGDEIFTAPKQGGTAVEVYDYDASGTARLKRAIGVRDWIDPGVSILDVAVLGDELFVLARIIGEDDAIYVFDASADGIAVPKRMIVHPNYLAANAWGIDVVGDEIIVATNTDDANVVTFDRLADGAPQPVRSILYDGPQNRPFSSNDVMLVGGELYTVAFFDGFVAFDGRAGGTRAPKRYVFHEELLSASDVFVTPDRDPVQSVFSVSLEEPVDGGTYSGIGNLRGWSVSSQGISRVDILIDGELFQSAPYGGARGDVAGAFPSVAGSAESGFSLAFNYNSLSPGEHTITARAHTARGQTLESSSTFTAQNFGTEFLSNSNLVKLGGGVCEMSGNTASLVGVLVDGSTFDIGLQWGRAAQGFEIVSIEER